MEFQEKVAFVEWINCRLRTDKYLTKNAWGKYIPINPNGDDLFEAVKDGILLRYICLGDFCLFVSYEQSGVITLQCTLL